MNHRFALHHLLTAAGVAVVAAGVVSTTAGLKGQQPSSGIYTAEQAAAGLAAYQATCTACHLNDLRGRNEAPAVAGPNFMSAWGQRSAKDLFDYISAQEREHCLHLS